jgi:hypothetical protein
MLAVGTALAVPGLAAAAPRAALASSVGTREQVEWVRRASGNFVGAELHANGAGACSVLAAPLRATQGRRTCAERWDARLAALLRKPRFRAALNADARAIPSAKVLVHGDTASIELPAPLLSGPNRLRWTEMCWMLEG